MELTIHTRKQHSE